MRRILIEDSVMKVAEEYANILTADKITGWDERPLDRLIHIQNTLIEDCNYSLSSYVGYIINHYRDLLLLPSENFAKLHNDFFYRWDNIDLFTIIRVKNGEKTFRDAILWAMRYDDIRDNILPAIIRKLEINACVYCNEVPITTTEQYLDIKCNPKCDTRYQIDHYWPQSKYPYLSSSFFNFQPSCANCNHQKGDEDALFNLYTLSTDDNNLSPFHFIFGSDDIVLEAIIKQEWSKLDIRLVSPYDAKLGENHQRLFRIDALYRTDKYKKKVLWMANKVFSNNESYVQSLRDSLPIITISDDAVKEDSFMELGYYLHDNLVHYQELNMLAIDVVRYMNVQIS